MSHKVEMNVWKTLALQPAFAICTSLATTSQLSAYLLEVTGSETKVGLATGAQGLANVIAAFPAAFFADWVGRTGVIAGAVVFGLIGFGGLAVAVHFQTFLGMTLALVAIGAYLGGQNAGVEAIFGDSVPSGARSKVYAWKSSLRTAGNAIGPLLSVLIFATLGNTWKPSELRWCITIGAAFFIFPAVLALSLTETKGIAASSDALVPGQQCDDDDKPLTKEAMRMQRRIVTTVIIADLVNRLGAGCSIKFFPLFFKTRCGWSPILVNLTSAVGTFGSAVLGILCQRLSTKIGRIEVTFLTKITAFLCLIGIALSHDNTVLVPLYLVREFCVNASLGLTKSVLNDYVPKSQRARWNSFEAVNTFGWSGSASLGGYIIERHGYRINFFVTAAVQLLAACYLLTIASHVHRETSFTKSRRHPGGGPPRGGGASSNPLAVPLLRSPGSSPPVDDIFASEDDSKHDASPRDFATASDAGYSLLDLEENNSRRDATDDDRSPSSRPTNTTS